MQRLGSTWWSIVTIKNKVTIDSDYKDVVVLGLLLAINRS